MLLFFTPQRAERIETCLTLFSVHFLWQPENASERQSGWVRLGLPGHGRTNYPAGRAPQLPTLGSVTRQSSGLGDWPTHRPDSSACRVPRDPAGNRTDGKFSCPPGADAAPTAGGTGQRDGTPGHRDTPPPRAPGTLPSPAILRQVSRPAGGGCRRRSASPPAARDAAPRVLFSAGGGGAARRRASAQLFRFMAEAAAALRSPHAAGTRLPEGGEGPRGGEGGGGGWRVPTDTAPSRRTFAPQPGGAPAAPPTAAPDWGARCGVTGAERRGGWRHGGRGNRWAGARAPRPRCRGAACLGARPARPADVAPAAPAGERGAARPGGSAPRAPPLPCLLRGLAALQVPLLTRTKRGARGLGTL